MKQPPHANSRLLGRQGEAPASHISPPLPLQQPVPVVHLHQSQLRRSHRHHQKHHHGPAVDGCLCLRCGGHLVDHPGLVAAALLVAAAAVLLGPTRRSTPVCRQLQRVLALVLRGVLLVLWQLQYEWPAVQLLLQPPLEKARHWILRLLRRLLHVAP